MRWGISFDEIAVSLGCDRTRHLISFKKIFLKQVNEGIKSVPKLYVVLIHDSAKCSCSVLTPYTLAKKDKYISTVWKTKLNINTLTTRHSVNFMSPAFREK